MVSLLPFCTLSNRLQLCRGGGRLLLLVLSKLSAPARSTVRKRWAAARRNLSSRTHPC